MTNSSSMKINSTQNISIYIYNVRYGYGHKWKVVDRKKDTFGRVTDKEQVLKWPIGRLKWYVICLYVLLW